MADLDDQLLAAAFADFRNEVAPYVRPAGTESAHATVRHRRRVRATVATTLAALAIAAPVGAYAAAGGDSHGPPVQPADSVTAAVSGAPSPSPTPSSSPSASVSPPAPADNRIPRAELDKATLDVPDWASDAIVTGCVSGPVKFSGGAHFIRDSVHIYLDQVEYVDLDGDGGRETVIRMSCGDQTTTFQVVAFARADDGGIRTLGQVVRQTGEIRTICGLRAGTDGAVEAQVGDYATPLRCFEPGPHVQFQWRAYSWDGARFAQSGGPTSFPPNPKVTDLAVAATDLAFRRAEGGGLAASMTVTVRNDGAFRLPYRVSLSLPDGLGPQLPGGCQLVPYPQAVVISCDRDGLAPGETTTLTIQFLAPAPVTVGLVPIAEVSMADGYADSNRANNSAEFRIVF
ncbi:hypothetical protein ACFFX1_18305 [Dactylosporangium sucinum]|uniref:CARDB domain-containing protein n=1 Tax=Dactylosporangium sucinum TaxID=1424081 RepID=A0A917WYV6_9ACTN|nr:hypothetical protein [Dactylosporangium sucinum]GGM41171.1 hypothetical protein GCM10007977_048240 [Dactylosporangium sucinum]